MISTALAADLRLPREDQLRDALAGTFIDLARLVDDERASAAPIRAAPISYIVTIMVDGEKARFVSDDPAEAYGLALLALLRSLA